MFPLQAGRLTTLLLHNEMRKTRVLSRAARFKTAAAIDVEHGSLHDLESLDLRHKP